MDQNRDPIWLSSPEHQQVVGKADPRDFRSLTGDLLRSRWPPAAIEFARDQGATAVAGHPVDIAALGSARVAGSAIFTGTVAMISASGFAEIWRTHPSRPVMWLKL